MRVKGFGEIEDEIGRGRKQLAHYRLDFVVNGEPRDFIAERLQRVFELIEHRIDRRLERVLCVEENYVH